MEIDDQPQQYVEQSYVAEQLHLITGMNRFDEFCFNERALFD
jgi:hypothetical protein